MYISIPGILQQRILLLDGALGTMIQTFHLTEDDFRGTRFSQHPCELKGDNDVLVLTKPEVLRSIHEAYLRAGADIITTDTFNGNRYSQADYHLENFCYEINKTAAQVAKSVANTYSTPSKPRFVAGSIGPTSKTLSISPDVTNPAFRSLTFHALKDAFKEQISGLLDGGVDLLLLETCFDTLNVKAALSAIHDLYTEEGAEWSLDDIIRHQLPPIMVSATLSDESGRLLSGQTLTAFIHAMSSYPLMSVGLNCSLGAEEIRPHLSTLAQKAPFFISVHPNAGLPNTLGDYEDTPEKMASVVSEFVQQKWVNILGGCCGTTPDHIRRFAEIIAKGTPHQPVPVTGDLLLSGLEPLIIGKGMNFTYIGERCNVAGSKKFARLIRDKQYEEALHIARQQVENGAQVIDINMDDAMLDAKSCMVTFLQLIASEPEIAKVPVMIDASSWEVLEAGLQCVQGKSIVNSISIKEGEKRFLEHARTILQYGAAVVIMAFDEDGQATTYQRRIDICKRAYDLLLSIGFPPQDIIFDPNILSIGTGLAEHNHFAVDYIETVRWIKTHLPHAKVSGGVSNLSFAFRGNNGLREAMHSVFLYHAIAAGMDMGIVNAGMIQVYDEIPAEQLKCVEDVVLDRCPDATEQLIAMAQTFNAQATTQDESSDWRKQPLAGRIQHAMVKGIVDFIAEDMEEAVHQYPHTIDIISGPLMAGMDTVGSLFGIGKMFLPQVIKSARVMKQAVSYLQPYIESEKVAGGNKSAGKVLLATVKGDVHDIGKNIVGIVLSCNNYEVIDLGVMTPAEKIIETAIKEKADIIALSGLITPSLDEMINVLREMERCHMDIPVIIGGATTSAMHTAIKMAPVYSYPVIYAKDAAQNIGILNSLLSTQYAPFVTRLQAEQESLRQQHAQTHRTFCSASEALANRFHPDFSHYTPTRPHQLGITRMEEVDIQSLIPYINWTYFFKAWDISGHYPGIFQDPAKGVEARELFDQAQALLQTIIQEKLLKAKGVAGLFPAQSIDDRIEVFTDESRNEILATLYPRRNRIAQTDGKPNLSLADFVAAKDSGIADYIGMFAVTAGIGLREQVDRFKQQHDDFNAILLQSLSDRLVEALAEKIHQEIRIRLWGFCPDEKWSPDELRTVVVQGIRPAPGYPAYPDHAEKATLFRLLQAESLGMTLTGNYSMLPTATICALVLAHPASHYFIIEEPSTETSTCSCGIHH